MGERDFPMPGARDVSSRFDRSYALLRNPGISEGEAAQCALFLAGRARDKDELRMLLEMLGLIPYESAEHRDRIPDGSRMDYRRP
jgi:hypothetical protein